MKRIVLLLILAVVVGCTSVEKSVKESMEYLASDELEGRATGTTGIEKAAVFIEDYFEAHDIKPYFETYRDSFNIGDVVGYNVVGMIEGNDPEFVF